MKQRAETSVITGDNRVNSLGCQSRVPTRSVSLMLMHRYQLANERGRGDDHRASTDVAERASERLSPLRFGRPLFESRWIGNVDTL
jgi:hypothetical protein